MGERWYAAVVEPQRVQLACHELMTHGFPVCNPIYLSRRVHRHKVQEIPQPLFHGYVFTSFDVAVDYWQNINRFRGIKRVLSTASGTPFPLRASVITEILTRAEQGPLRDISWLEKFRPGQTAKATTGSFEGITGRCTRTMKERVWLMMTFFGTEREVEFRAKDLELA